MDDQIRLFRNAMLDQYEISSSWSTQPRPRTTFICLSSSDITTPTTVVAHHTSPAHHSAPSPAPANAADIPTVQFRIFYPAVAESNQKPINWLPSPQRQHVSGYTKFMGVGARMANMIS